MTEPPQSELSLVGLSPLAQADWRYVEKLPLEDFRADDWALMNRQRTTFYARFQAEQVLAFLRAGEALPSFGYQVNNFRHCLQSATLALEDGRDEETVVVALLHDIGFVACPETHGTFAASLLAPYISEANRWMLERHAIFQQIHVHEHPAITDPDERERWRGHPHFEWTAEFVAKYDQDAMRPDFETAPLATFEPLVRRLFARPPRAIAVD